MTEKIKSEVISRRRVFSLLGLAIASGLVATIPVSLQVTPRGVELSVDQAQAVTYRRARVTARRVDRGTHRSRSTSKRRDARFVNKHHAARRDAYSGNRDGRRVAQSRGHAGT